MSRPRPVEVARSSARDSDRTVVLVCAGLCVVFVAFVAVALVCFALVTTRSGSSGGGFTMVYTLLGVFFGAVGVVGAVVSGGLVFVFRTHNG